MSSDASSFIRLVHQTKAYWQNNIESNQYYFKDLLMNDINFLINEVKKNNIQKLFDKLHTTSNEVIVMTSDLTKDQKKETLNNETFTQEQIINEQDIDNENSLLSLLNTNNASNHAIQKELKELIKPNTHLYILIPNDTIYYTQFDNNKELSSMKNINLKQLLSTKHDKYFEKEINTLNYLIKTKDYNSAKLKELLALLQHSKSIPLSFIYPLETLLNYEKEVA